MKKKVLCLLAIALSGALPALASSHREAPFVSRTPKVDGTDYYVFNSYQRGREKYVTMIADYLPLQDGYGGPNFFNLDPDAIYEIHLDNNADAKEDLTFQFKFKTTLKDIQLPIGTGENQKMVSVPFTNVGAFSAGNLGALNVQESYTVNVIRGARRSGKLEAVSNLQTGAKEFLKPADNIGKK